MSRSFSCWASMSSLVQRKPPMLAMPSFLADMVQPSP